MKATGPRPPRARAAPGVDPRHAAGARAEALAAAYLEARGCAVLERNFRCRTGEIDLIARDGDTLVFVEVRLRRRVDYGGAAASIDARKQGKLLAAAAYYLARHARPPPCRFDAVLLDALDPPRIEWLRDAFGASR
jgi:putative endonuclease